MEQFEGAIWKWGNFGNVLHEFTLLEVFDPRCSRLVERGSGDGLGGMGRGREGGDPQISDTTALPADGRTGRGRFSP